MPRGIPKQKEEAPKVTAPKAEPEVVKESKPAPTVKVLDPLGPGQAYFEAPDGTVIIGEDTKDQVWYRALRNGKGGWINRKR